MKRLGTDWENIFTKHVSYKESYLEYINTQFYLEHKRVPITQ